MVMASSSARRPVRSSRTQVRTYNEESSSDDRRNEDTESEIEEARRASLSLRPRDTRRTRVSYREETTDDEDDLQEEPLSDHEAIRPADAPTHLTYPYPSSEQRGSSRTSHRPRNRTVKTRSQTKKSTKPLRRSRSGVGKPRNKRRKVDDEPTFVGSGVIPPWQTLPYQVLFDIFIFASRPLVDEKTIARMPSVQWLVNVATLCRAFHEPALAALYHSPPLIPAAKAHGLLSVLSQPQDHLSTNYVNKVRELHVDVETLLLYKSGPTLGYFELPRLIECTPQVKTLRLYHNDDYVVGLPPWQIQRSKWTYPDSLFSAIAARSIRLRSWDWNSRFMETTRLLPMILGKHLEPAFRGLRELRLLHVASEYSDGDDVESLSNEREVVLATALKELSELQTLQFIECSIVNEHLLLNLPLSLKSLTINNCDDVTTANFSAFLSSHGQSLHELVLCHNRHLSLSFIVGLAQACGQLETFKMDISMYDWSSYHDVEPHFVQLLSPTEVPTWPSTLKEIELIQLRKWDDATAEVFFTSLINSASDLRSLRRLVISAILKIGWRDRASFREKWIGRLEKVFLRHSPPPDPTLRTIPRPPSHPGRTTPPTNGAPADDGMALSDAQHSGPSSASKRKSARLAQRKFSEAEESEFSPVRQTRNHGNDDSASLTVQGMCEVVMVRIDNQRPTETQFNEQDFLDEELSGDEDWNGDDLDMSAGGHAW